MTYSISIIRNTLKRLKKLKIASKRLTKLGKHLKKLVSSGYDGTAPLMSPGVVWVVDGKVVGFGVVEKGRVHRRPLFVGFEMVGRRRARDYVSSKNWLVLSEVSLD